MRKTLLFSFTPALLFGGAAAAKAEPVVQIATWKVDQTQSELLGVGYYNTTEAHRASCKHAAGNAPVCDQDRWNALYWVRREPGHVRAVPHLAGDARVGRP